MENKYEYSDELYHHGIKGMKWGIRRYENEDGTLTPAGKKRYAREAKREARYESVKQYRDAMDRASQESDAADDAWYAAKKQYKSLGKNPISRIREAAKGRSKAAKEYSKMYNKASEMSDAADETTRKAQELYKNTGSNALSRAFNNAEYEFNRRRQSNDRYTATESDIIRYGKRQANRIAKYRNRKGMNHNTAVRYANNRKKYGRKAANRIEKRVRRGENPNSARVPEVRRKFVKTALKAYGAYKIASFAYRHRKVLGAGAKIAKTLIGMKIRDKKRGYTTGHYGNSDYIDAEWS